MLPHHHLLISRLASRFLSKRVAGVTGNRQEVGLFIRLPDFLAEQYPSLGDEDTSPPHVTFFYSGEVTKGREEEWLTIVQGELSKLRGPVRAAVDGSVDYFEHADKGRTVAFTPVRFSHDLAAAKWNLRERLLEAGFEIKDRFPLVFKPHVTLAYLDGFDYRWRGQRPVGAWDFDEIEVWGLPQMFVIPLGSDAARPRWEAISISDDGEVKTRGEKLEEQAVSDKMAKRLAHRYLEITPPPFAD